MITNCLQAFTNAFDNFKYEFSDDVMKRILDINCPIAWICVGKSVPIALTNVRLARSFGISWTVIDANDAWHGDFGALTKDHLIGYVSKSGNTDELLKTAEYLYDRHYPGSHDAFVITSNPKGKILKYVNVGSIIIPIENEGSPWNHAPFVSTSLYLLAMNMLLAGATDRANISKEAYFDFHPGGQIGKDLKNELN